MVGGTGSWVEASMGHHITEAISMLFECIGHSDTNIAQGYLMTVSVLFRFLSSAADAAWRRCPPAPTSSWA